MTEQKAETIVLLSALVVGGGYLYRRTSEGEPHSAGKGSTALRVLGQGETLPTGKFVTGFGVSFIVISMLASVAPDLGASFAGLVATGSVLFNGTQISKDVKAGISGSAHPLQNLPAATGLESTLQPIPGLARPSIPNNHSPGALGGVTGGVAAGG